MQTLTITLPMPREEMRRLALLNDEMLVQQSQATPNAEAMDFQARQNAKNLAAGIAPPPRR